MRSALFRGPMALSRRPTMRRSLIFAGPLAAPRLDLPPLTPLSVRQLTHGRSPFSGEGGQEVLGGWGKLRFPHPPSKPSPSPPNHPPAVGPPTGRGRGGGG